MLNVVGFARASVGLGGLGLYAGVQDLPTCMDDVLIPSPTKHCSSKTSHRQQGILTLHLKSRQPLVLPRPYRPLSTHQSAIMATMLEVRSASDVMAQPALATHALNSVTDVLCLGFPTASRRPPSSAHASRPVCRADKSGVSPSQQPVKSSLLCTSMRPRIGPFPAASITTYFCHILHHPGGSPTITTTFHADSPVPCLSPQSHLAARSRGRRPSVGRLAGPNDGASHRPALTHPSIPSPTVTCHLISSDHTHTHTHTTFLTSSHPSLLHQLT